nr:hypothetical protein [Xenococcaceae cyanobacterium MO_207.B15]
GTPEEFEETRGGIFAEATETGQPGSITLGSAANPISELVIQNGAEISTAAKDIGDNETLGNITVTANNVTLNNEGIINSRTDGTRNAGRISITANNEFKITTGGSIEAESTASGDLDAGNAGDVSITALIIDIDNGTISSQAQDNQATGGDITLLATGSQEAIAIKNNSRIEASSNSDPDQNNDSSSTSKVDIAATNGSINVSDSEVTTANSGSAVAGTLTIAAKDSISITNSNISSDGNFGRIGIGDPTNLDLEISDSLIPSNIVIQDSQITTNSNIGDEEGGSGTIRIQAQGDIEIRDISSEPDTETLISTTTFGDAFDLDGLIEITANNLTVDNGKIQSNSGSSGNGRFIFLNINNKFILSGEDGEISTNTVDGDGGAIFIAKDTEPALQALLDEDLSSVEDVDITLLTLRAANVDLEATSIIEINDGTISTSTQSIGDGGLIKIESNNLTINNGTITSNAQGSGNAGTIFLDINDKLNLSEPNSQILSTSTDGTGGTIIIAKDTETAVQEFLNSDSDIEAVANVDLEATSTVEINGGVISATTRGSGNAGLIRIESGDLIVGNQDEQNGRIRIESRSQSIEEDSGNAGNIILNAENNISLNNVTISSQAVGRNAASGDVILSATGQDIENTDGSIEPSIMIRDSIIEANSNNDDSELLFSTILIEARQGSININNSTVTTDNNGSAFAGNVEIYAADDIVIENNSTISSNGDFGFVLIGDSETDKVTIQNSQIRATNDVSTDSSSQAGLIEIQAQGNIESNSSEISGTTSGAGVGGSITISSENGNFTSTGSIIEASSTGLNDTGDEIPAGEAGNIFITAGNININDTNIDNTAQDSDAGSVSLQADSSIRLIDTTIDVAAFGLDGKSGDITIEALNEGTVELISQDPDSLSTIFIESFADLPGEKTGGNLSIIGGSINIEGYQLDARVFGEGDGGNISIVGNSITILNGSEIITETTSRGNAGDISIQAQDNIEISDINSESDTSTLISSNTSGEGNGGDITITSVQGSITSIPENAENNPGRIEITSESETSGNAGTITLNATNEQLGNITLDNARVSSQATDIGDSNDITLNSPVVVLQNNTEVTAQTNSGESGTVVFSDIKTLDVINSVVSSSTQSGQAQSITINSVDTENGSVTIDGQGTFTRDDGTSETRGGIFTEATETGGRAGSLTINASTLSLSNNTQLSASNVDDQTANEGENLKNINLNVDNLTVENSEITISTESGVAGNVTVNGSEGTANASESVTINGQGTFTRNSGTPEEFEETRGGIFAEAENSGQAGNINIFTSNLTVKNKTEISSNAQNTANAGNIELQIGNQLSLDDATIDVSTFDGNPGNIFINNDDNPVPEIRIQNGATISANRGNGQEDNLSEQSLIRITTNNLTIENQSTIESNTFGRGDGGDILIEIVDDQIVDDPNQGNLIITRTGNSDETTGVVADARGTGRGGTIIIAKDINDELIDAIREINAGSSLSDINNRINNFSEPVEPIDRVIMSNGATISANTNTDEKGQNLISGERTGGNIFISTLALSQDNDSNITAGIPKLSLEERNQLQIEIEETEEITAGNILLKLDGDRELQEDNLFSLPEKTVILSNDSDIRTEGSEGGKIFINARFVIASDNSDVITTFTGGDFTGGDADIAILDDGLVVGLREREQDTPLNDITGNNVTINSPEIDNQLVPQLSQEVVDVSSLIDRRCAISSGDNVSSFTMVGQGGLPPNLDKFLSIPDILPDFGTFEPEIEENSDKTQTITPSFSFAKSNLQAEVAAYTTTWKFPQNCFAASVDK